MKRCDVTAYMRPPWTRGHICSAIWALRAHEALQVPVVSPRTSPRHSGQAAVPAARVVPESLLLRPSGPMSTTVYTEGACVINPGPGGWAWAAPEIGYASGAHAATTNQRMELSAVLEAVHANPGELRIVSDAKYVLDCFGQAWHEQWQRTRWKTSAGKPVTNPDLWQPLLAAYHTREARIEFEWVKGHSNDPTNDIVDRLATEAARTQTGRAGAWPPTDLDEPDRPAPIRPTTSWRPSPAGT